MNISSNIYNFKFFKVFPVLPNGKVSLSYYNEVRDITVSLLTARGTS